MSWSRAAPCNSLRTTCRHKVDTTPQTLLCGFQTDRQPFLPAEENNGREEEQASTFLITIKRPAQTPLMIASTPFRLIFLEHCGLWESINSFKYILVTVETCSRFPWLWPERSADIRTVVKNLQGLVAMGAVHTFHADSGPAFASKAFQEAMTLMGVNLQCSNPI